MVLHGELCDEKLVYGRRNVSKHARILQDDTEGKWMNSKRNKTADVTYGPSTVNETDHYWKGFKTPVRGRRWMKDEYVHIEVEDNGSTKCPLYEK